MKRFLALPIAALLILTACTAKQSASQNRVSGATLVYAEGVVAMDGIQIEIGAKILDGALLTTDGDGGAEIVFGGKNIIRMGPNTAMRVELASLSRVVSVQRGTLTAVLRKLDRLKGGKMEVRTPNAVAGVRGTSFFVRVNTSRQETYVCICNGRIALAKTDGSDQVAKQAKHHNATVYTGEAASVAVSVPGPGYDHGHSDRDLEKLAARIGEKMDWTKIE